MDNRNIKRVMSFAQLFYALLWAAAIILGSLFFKNNEYYYIVFGFLVIGSSMHLSLLGYISKRLLSKNSEHKLCLR